MNEHREDYQETDFAAWTFLGENVHETGFGLCYVNGNDAK
jgi:hypothetical protein